MTAERDGLFQSTLPCGSDRNCFITLTYNDISIHAPLRERLGAVVFFFYNLFISIHAPLRERLVFHLLVDFSYNFNPRSLAGATLWYVAQTILQLLFQSTLPCGSDSILALMSLGISYFNPRSLAGATAFSKGKTDLTYYFNPRSLAGATSIFARNVSLQSNFNPRSLAGATSTRLILCFAISVFQSTLPRGSDLKLIILLLILAYFNPRSLAGATRSISQGRG